MGRIGFYLLFYVHYKAIVLLQGSEQLAILFDKVPDNKQIITYPQTLFSLCRPLHYRVYIDSWGLKTLQIASVSHDEGSCVASLRSWGTLSGDAYW